MDLATVFVSIMNGHFLEANGNTYALHLCPHLREFYCTWPVVSFVFCHSLLENVPFRYLQKRQT